MTDFALLIEHLFAVDRFKPFKLYPSALQKFSFSVLPSSRGKNKSNTMALKTVKISLHSVVRLVLAWHFGMVSRTAGQTTFPANYEGVYFPATGSSESQPPMESCIFSLICGTLAISITCDYPAIYTTSGAWAGCCYEDSPDCLFFTKCSGGIASGESGVRWNWYVIKLNPRI